MRYVENPPNPFEKYSSEFLGEPSPVKLEVYEERSTKKIITKAWSSDFGSRYTVNCYRGCMHACTYCFARRYHEFIGYGSGTDFETKIVVKVNAPEILRAELKRTRQKMPHLDFSFATDPYLPLEASYELTRNCLKVCREMRIRTLIVTKSPLVTRDIDILKDLNVTVMFSIPFLTKEKSNPFELYTPNPDVRFRAMKTLSDEGIKVGIGIAPVILGYNESDIPKLLEKAKENGASKAFMSLVHFDSESILDYFTKRLHEKIPTKAEKILNTMRRERDGKLLHRSYKERVSGTTEQWETAKKMFDLNFKRLGFERSVKTPEKVEEIPTQPTLF